MCDPAVHAGSAPPSSARISKRWMSAAIGSARAMRTGRVGCTFIVIILEG
jgi:hypothetical protein